MKKMSLILTIILAAACQEKQAAPEALADPTDLKVEQSDLTTVRLTWTDNAQGEKEYRIYLS